MFHFVPEIYATSLQFPLFLSQWWMCGQWKENHQKFLFLRRSGLNLKLEALPPPHLVTPSQASFLYPQAAYASYQTIPTYMMEQAEVQYFLPLPLWIQHIQSLLQVLTTLCHLPQDPQQLEPTCWTGSSRHRPRWWATWSSRRGRRKLVWIWIRLQTSQGSSWKSVQPSQGSGALTNYTYSPGQTNPCPGPLGYTPTLTPVRNPEDGA